MSIAIRSETSGSANGASSIVTITKPSSVSDNDYLVVFLGVGDDLTVAGSPAGWTSYQHGTSTGNDRQMLIAYKKITNAAGEPASYDFSVETGDNAAWWIGSLSGVDGTNPVDVMGSWADLSNDLTPAAPSITTTSASSLVFAAWASNYISSATMPNGWNTRINNKINTTIGLNVASRTALDSGSATGNVEITTAQTGMETTCVQIAFVNYVPPTYQLTTGCPINILSSEAPSLIQHYGALTVYQPSDLLQSENAVLTYHPAPVNLVVGDSQQILYSDSFELEYHATITVSDSQNILYSENTTLTQNHILIVSDSTNLHSSDSPVLAIAFNIVVTDSQNVLYSENITFPSGTIKQKWMLLMTAQ